MWNSDSWQGATRYTSTEVGAALSKHKRAQDNADKLIEDMINRMKYAVERKYKFKIPFVDNTITTYEKYCKWKNRRFFGAYPMDKLNWCLNKGLISKEQRAFLIKNYKGNQGSEAGLKALNLSGKDVWVTPGQSKYISYYGSLVIVDKMHT
jgi:hypothetical protein